jgi:cytochrome c oxidase cbb3-type subunit II
MNLISRLRNSGHEVVEKNIGLMAMAIALVISVGGLVEIIPLMMSAQTIEPAQGIARYPALQLAGRNIYLREGCYNCHSQMIRTLSFETQRYGHYSVAGESVYDRPFQWGSKRTGPDLARVGTRHLSDDWQRAHLLNPRSVVPESNMPGYPWLAKDTVDPASIQAHMRVLQKLGDGYTDAEIAEAAGSLSGKTEMDALVAYLQNLGNHTDFGSDATVANVASASTPTVSTPPAVTEPNSSESSAADATGEQGATAPAAASETDTAEAEPSKEQGS